MRDRDSLWRLFGKPWAVLPDIIKLSAIWTKVLRLVWEHFLSLATIDIWALLFVFTASLSDWILRRTWNDPRMRSNTSLSSVFMFSGIKANMMKFIPKSGINKSVDFASLLLTTRRKKHKQLYGILSCLS